MAGRRAPSRQSLEEGAALLADCTVAGCLAFAASLPLITSFAALTAACALLAERAALGQRVTVRAYWSWLRRVARSGPWPFVAPALLAALLGLDAVAVRAGVPGGALVGVAVAAAGGVLAVLGLRAAARWRPGAAWPEVARAAARHAAGDVPGSLLLGLAAACAAAISWAVPLMAPLALGPLALGAVAVERGRSSLAP